MEVFHIFDVRKRLLAGLSLPARMCKLNTQSLAHAIPCLTTCLGCLVLQMGKMRPRSFCDISDLGTLSLKQWESTQHAPVWLLAPSQCSLPHRGHSLLILKRALMTVLQTTAVGSDARDLSRLYSSYKVLFMLKSSNLPKGHYLLRWRSRLWFVDMLVWAAL